MVRMQYLVHIKVDVLVITLAEVACRTPVRPWGAGDRGKNSARSAKREISHGESENKSETEHKRRAQHRTHQISFRYQMWCLYALFRVKSGVCDMLV